MTLPAETDALIAKYKAEASAYKAEARYHNLQADRLTRLRRAEESGLDKQRILDFTSEVGYGNVRNAMNTLSEWRADDPTAPITVRLLTPGGDAIAGLAFYDYMEMLVKGGTPVTTVGIGMAASMGAVLLQAGSTRYVTPSAYLMVHEVATVAAGKVSEIIDEAKFTARVQDRLLTILAAKSHMTKAAIKRKWARKDWWLDAEEAVKVGFADAILEGGI